MTDTSQEIIEARAAAGARERARLAREIHDGVAQDLAGLGYRLDDLATASGIPPNERGEIREIRVGLSQTLNRLRNSIFDLRNSDFDLVADIRELLRGIERIGIQVSFTCEFDETALDPAVARELRYIAFEALSNVVRHSSATQLTFALEDQDKALRMAIADNGVGHASFKEFSYGLATMSERAQIIGATFTVENPESGGTIITVVAPHL